jgi:RNA polymerase sigma-70 factor, ECF subfamily
VPSRLPLPSGKAAPSRLASVHRLPLAGMDDAALVRAVMAGDEGAAGAVWERHAPLVRRVLRRSLGPYEDVEDLVQESFLRFFRCLGELRDPAALRSFLFGVALRVARAELRRRRVGRWLRLTPTGTLPDLPAGGGSPGDPAREAVRRLYAILDRLDDAGRLLFVLRYVEGLELTEVAAALDVSLATAKRRLAKVTARVTAMIERDPLLPEYAQSLLASPEDA